MTLDELLTEARAESKPGPATRRFWKALDAEIGRNLARHPHATQVEIGQLVLLAVWRKIDRYEQRGPLTLRRWVRAIIRFETQHTAFQAARLARLEAKLLRETPRSPGLTPSSHVLMLERRALAGEAFERLSPRHRRALDQLDPHELATSERISFHAARMLIHRALRRLAELMDELSETSRVRTRTSS